MTNLSIVPLVLPETLEAVRCLRKLADLFEAGEFESFLVVAFRPDETFITVERGKKLDKLRFVGLLETIKADAIAAMLVEK